MYLILLVFSLIYLVLFRLGLLKR